MNRRELFKTLAAGMGAAAVSVSSGDPRPQRRRKHGRLTVDSHRAHQDLTGEFLRTFVNGVDVTDSCYEADDVEGYALVFCRDEQTHRTWAQEGHLHIGGNGAVCRMKLTGDVVICPGEAL